ncbi:MAG: hypothetical protein AVDCRST_MAG42-3194 [uncultured Chthoniobacterales bacterium]|uniref:Uncharacterized protein n=1 Tax=uncultured Chthoniobacterales bacterium TaxID=1836801 RepID=A0A6J4J2D6_9BACT|nr:MAG: hypothetical protein AVDCRST_MAG42-3194 [uncultured Chthoniobacterales bacterium]
MERQVARRGPPDRVQLHYFAAQLISRQPEHRCCAAGLKCTPIMEAPGSASTTMYCE